MPLKVRLNLDYIFVLFTMSKLEISDWGNLTVALIDCQMVVNTRNRGLLSEGYW